MKLSKLVSLATVLGYKIEYVDAGTAIVTNDVYDYQDKLEFKDRHELNSYLVDYFTVVLVDDIQGR